MAETWGQWLKSWWEGQAENYVAAYLAGRDGDTTPSNSFNEGGHYFTIALECMRIVLAREAFTKFYGVLSGQVGFDLARGPEAITLIISPDDLKGIEKKDLGRIIVQTVPLCEKIPYIGGNIDLRLALLSLESTNLLNGLVDVLTSVTKAAGVGYVEQAKTFLTPIEKGIDLLRTQGGCEIGLYKAISQPKTGYYCVARAPAKRLDLPKCRLSAAWELIDQTGKIVVDVPYFVLSVQAHDRKRNFGRIPSIREAYAKLNEAAVKGDEAPAREALAFFTRTVTWSDDLLPADKDEIIASAHEKMEKSFPARRTSAAAAEATRRELPPLEQLVPWGETPGEA